MQIRATDVLRNIPESMSLRNLLSQSIAEHNFMTASLLEFILLYCGNHLKTRGFLIQDPVYASFMALHHDDDEWEFGDLVPNLGYGCANQADKEAIAASSMRKLYGTNNNFILKAYDEYENRQTPTAQLVKVCDILELFCHNRVLLCHGIGVITKDNCQDFLPEARVESEQFLATFGRNTSVAEVLECVYIKKYADFAFSPALDILFYDMYDAIRNFDFRYFITLPAGQSLPTFTST